MLYYKGCYAVEGIEKLKANKRLIKKEDMNPASRASDMAPEDSRELSMKSDKTSAIEAQELEEEVEKLDGSSNTSGNIQQNAEITAPIPENTANAGAPVNMEPIMQVKENQLLSAMDIPLSQSKMQQHPEINNGG